MKRKLLSEKRWKHFILTCDNLGWTLFSGMIVFLPGTNGIEIEQKKTHLKGVFAKN